MPSSPTTVRWTTTPQRDAVVGNYIDREEAGRTAGDVRRFERTAFYLRVRRAKLIKTRDRLLSRLPD